MTDISFEPFGESLPTPRPPRSAKPSDRLYRATIVGFWVMVAVVVVARIVASAHGSVFNFAG